LTNDQGLPHEVLDPWKGIKDNIMESNNLHDFYFDRYQRYKAAADMIYDLHGRSPGLKILDIGSLDNTFAAFLPEHTVMPYDQVIDSVQGGVPYNDKHFDMAVALDVLEHVPPDERAFFILEISRVSRLGFILAFPIASAKETEDFVLELTGSVWLSEHKRYGLPEADEIEALLREMGFSFIRHPNACLPSWMAMMLLMHGTEKPMRIKISSFFNKHFYELENGEPAYRYIYLCTKPDKAK